MAWIATVAQKTGTAYKVRWREPGLRAPRGKNFRTPTEAEAFRDQMTAAFPRPPRRGGSGGRGRPAAPIKDRIHRSVKVDGNGCWRWQLSVGKEGYGFIALRVDRKPVRALAHRVSYTEFVAEIPAGLQIDHLCRVRDCVNPEHLEPVTASENIRRSPIHISVRRRKQEPGAPCSAERHGTVYARQKFGCCCIEAFEAMREASRLSNQRTTQRRLAEAGAR